MKWQELTPDSKCVNFFKVIGYRGEKYITELLIPDCAAEQTWHQCHSQGKGVNYFRISMTAAKNIMTLTELERLKQAWKLSHSHIKPHIGVWWKQRHQGDNKLKSKSSTMKQNSLCFALIYNVPSVKLFLCSTLSRNCCALATWHGQGEMQWANVSISVVCGARTCLLLGRNNRAANARCHKATCQPSPLCHLSPHNPDTQGLCLHLLVARGTAHRDSVVLK